MAALSFVIIFFSQLWSIFKVNATLSNKTQQVAFSLIIISAKGVSKRKSVKNEEKKAVLKKKRVC